MGLHAIQMINAYLKFVMQASAWHHKLLEFPEHQSHFAMTTASASPINSVIEMDSVQSSDLELSHRSALTTVTVVLESSVLAMNAFQNQ